MLLVTLVGSGSSPFLASAARFAPWGSVHAANMRLLEEFRQDELSGCQVIGTNGSVRGYLNFGLQRDIRELTTRETVLKHATSEGDCAIFVHTSRTAFTDLPELLEIEIFDSHGAILRRYGPT
jgi:hypothetical protein